MQNLQQNFPFCLFLYSLSTTNRHIHQRTSKRGLWHPEYRPSASKYRIYQKKIAAYTHSFLGRIALPNIVLTTKRSGNKALFAKLHFVDYKTITSIMCQNRQITPQNGYNTFVLSVRVSLVRSRKLHDQTKYKPFL